jgi:hypothetical protein
LQTANQFSQQFLLKTASYVLFKLTHFPVEENNKDTMLDEGRNESK